jgi:hypothetical protein
MTVKGRNGEGNRRSEAMNFQHLFALGMKRRLPELLSCDDGPVFDVGASGKYVVPGATPLGTPEWRWPRDKIPSADDLVGELHAYHFLEHLRPEDAVSFLREVERVLIPERGVFTFSVPYYSSVLAVQDLEHRSSWCEETFEKLFFEETYQHDSDSARPWRLRVHFLLIAGVVSRNLALVGQIVKSQRATPPRDAWYYPSE